MPIELPVKVIGSKNNCYIVDKNGIIVVNGSMLTNHATAMRFIAKTLNATEK